ncbi:translin-associated factor X-interacting protein 1 isoform X2 [Larimichthys crocea]|uniref:translin-associated factor X-interacting protein 1 isoform X2 n=1 Tax=Larimichthys crocea TaxID=215358 RepID=UPI000F5F8046|nr:translin-associated factor X-interacting protein 1 isoform X2 [Larimichthys crocea]
MLKSHLDPRAHKVLDDLSARMSPHVRFPPLTPSQQQRLEQQHDTEEEDHEGRSVSVRPAAGKVNRTGGSYIYAGPGRKPQLLTHLESYVNKELQTIGPEEPKCQELKLQVYRHAFGCFIKEFKTYQPLLSAIKQEYEKTLAHQRDQIQELEPLRSCLRRVTEDCDRKIRARWAEEQAEIEELKREKRRLQKDVEDMREREKATQAAVDRLQSELSDQYLQYREERDARRLLIWQLSERTRGSATEEEQSADEDAQDSVKLQLALKVCRADLTKAQEELTRMKAEYWDVVPRRNWDALEQTHKQNLQQLKTLQRDFDQMKSEYDTLLELHKEASMQEEAHEPITAQTDESASEEQIQVQSNQLTAPVDSGVPESSTLTAQEFRAALRTAFPLKSDQDLDELVASAQSETDSDDAIPSQRLRDLLQQLAESDTSTASPEAPEENASGENAASDPPPECD